MPRGVSLDIRSKFRYFSHIMRTTGRSWAKYVAFAVLFAAVIAAGSFVYGQPQAAPAGKTNLVVYGDTVFFLRPGVPGNCTYSSEFKHGDNIGFRMTAI